MVVMWRPHWLAVMRRDIASVLARLERRGRVEERGERVVSFVDPVLELFPWSRS